MAQMSSAPNDENQRKGGQIALTICIAMVVILAVMVVVLLFRLTTNKNSSSEGETTSRRNVVVNKENVEEVASQMLEQNKTQAGSYEAKMNSTWYFENGSAVSENAYVENPISNTNAVYFDLIHSETGDTILKSPILPVGTHLDNISLDQSFPAGTYDCVCVYHLLDENDQPISKVSLKVTVVIRN